MLPSAAAPVPLGVPVNPCDVPARELGHAREAAACGFRSVVLLAEDAEYDLSDSEAPLRYPGGTTFWWNTRWRPQFLYISQTVDADDEEDGDTFHGLDDL